MKKNPTDKNVAGLAFVIHKHATVRAHYDFRLEIEGTMPSWAIPKGPTLDSTVKRLAMETTDHDMEYRHFEGVIPDGDYGAGAVMIWDQGVYVPEIEIEKGVREIVRDPKEWNRVMAEERKKGMLKFTLYGEKLHGSFALVKTRGFGPKNSWLMIKHQDIYSKEGYDAKEFDISVTTKRSIEQILSDA